MNNTELRLSKAYSILVNAKNKKKHNNFSLHHFVKSPLIIIVASLAITVPVFYSFTEIGKNLVYFSTGTVSQTQNDINLQRSGEIEKQLRSLREKKPNVDIYDIPGYEPLFNQYKALTFSIDKHLIDLRTDNLQGYFYWIWIVSALITCIIMLFFSSAINEELKKPLDRSTKPEQTLKQVFDEVFEELKEIDFSTNPLFSNALITTLSQIVMMIDERNPEEEDEAKAYIMFRQQELREMLKEPRARYHSQMKALNDVAFTKEIQGAEAS
jgi:hypothetical protein